MSDLDSAATGDRLAELTRRVAALEEWQRTHHEDCTKLAAAVQASAVALRAVPKEWR